MSDEREALEEWLALEEAYDRATGAEAVKKAANAIQAHREKVRAALTPADGGDPEYMEGCRDGLCDDNPNFPSQATQGPAALEIARNMAQSPDNWPPMRVKQIAEIAVSALSKQGAGAASAMYRRAVLEEAYAVLGALLATGEKT